MLRGRRNAKNLHLGVSGRDFLPFLEEILQLAGDPLRVNDGLCDNDGQRPDAARGFSFFFQSLCLL